jgi:hypothetical protein
VAVYIVGDARFLESKERDEVLIKNWNSVVTDEDLVLLLGDKLSDNGTWEELKTVFNKLKGKKKVIDVPSDDFHSEKWRELTNHKTYLVNGAIPCIIDGKEEVIMLATSLKGLGAEKGSPYCATTRSISGQTKLYDKKFLSISIDDWGMTPINYMDVGQMFDDMVLFEKMENKEVDLNEAN